MFDTLSDKLQHALGDLRGKGRLDEEAISKAMREIRLALLEADGTARALTDEGRQEFRAHADGTEPAYPIVVLVLPLLIPEPRWVYLAVAETFARMLKLEGFTVATALSAEAGQDLKPVISSFLDQTGAPLLSVARMAKPLTLDASTPVASQPKACERLADPDRIAATAERPRLEATIRAHRHAQERGAFGDGAARLAADVRARLQKALADGCTPAVVRRAWETAPLDCSIWMPPGPARRLMMLFGESPSRLPPPLGIS